MYESVDKDIISYFYIRILDFWQSIFLAIKWISVICRSQLVHSFRHIHLVNILHPNYQPNHCSRCCGIGTKKIGRKKWMNEHLWWISINWHFHPKNAKNEANDLFLEPITMITGCFIHILHIYVVKSQSVLSDILESISDILVHVSSYPSNGGFSQKRFNQHDTCFQNGSHIHNMDGPIFHREAFKFCRTDFAIPRNEPLKNRRI